MWDSLMLNISMQELQTNNMCVYNFYWYYLQSIMCLKFLKFFYIFKLFWAAKLKKNLKKIYFKYFIEKKTGLASYL